MASEPKRGCGYRKVGGLYLCSSGAGMPCDRLPWPLRVCPTCSHGFKQTRGWTWVDVAGLVGGLHQQCQDGFPCPLCMATEQMGKAGLLWIGEQFYKRPSDFLTEADGLGISRRITTIPHGFELGKTWVLLAHAYSGWEHCEGCGGSGLMPQLTDRGEDGGTVPGPCESCKGHGGHKLAAIFRVFRPTAIEKIVTVSQATNKDEMAALKKRGITPVVVPDDDKDHQGTVYEDAEEPA